MEWDDLKYFLELARTGTLTAASRRLQVQHSTVSRRVSRLEQAQGEPLFTRSSDGFILNRAGRTLLPQAEAIERAVLQVNPRLKASNDQISGTVRIGCPEGFGTYFVAPWASRLQKAYPGISIDLVVKPRNDLLARNEADIMIHIDRPTRGPYLVSKLFDYQLSLFASKDYLKRHSEPLVQTELRDHHFISYVADLEPTKELPNATHVAHATEPRFRATALSTQKAAVLAGCGIALLPDYAMADSQDVVRILGNQVSYRKTYYMLIPEDVQSISRISAIWRFLKAEFRG